MVPVPKSCLPPIKNLVVVCVMCLHPTPPTRVPPLALQPPVATITQHRRGRGTPHPHAKLSKKKECKVQINRKSLNDKSKLSWIIKNNREKQK